MIVVTHQHPFRRFSRKETFRVIRCVLRGEQRSKYSVSVVFTNSRFMRLLNARFLNHSFSTDVLAFPLGTDEKLNAEVYINLDKAKAHAREYRVSFANEVTRLLIHGTLHLMGYKDETRKAQTRMRRREDFYLSRLGY